MGRYDPGVPGRPLTLNFPGGGRQVSIADRGLRVGRSSDNDVVLADDLVSRHHAVLWSEQGRFFVRDEGSTNGTWLNGSRISGIRALKPSDQLQIGASVFTIQEGEGAPSPAGGRLWLWASLAAAVLLLAVGGIIWLASREGGAAGGGSNSGSGGIVAGATATPDLTTTPQPLATDTPPLDVDAVLMATVRLRVPIEGKAQVSIGSGSIISDEGYILTNFHVMGDPETQKSYNRQGMALIALNVRGFNNPPVEEYSARLIASDPNLDLAIVKIVSMKDGGDLPADLGLSVITIGDSNQVNIGDQLSVVGFPSLGGASVTLTKGTVSGYYEYQSRAKAFIKTDAEINPGNSGGLAVNGRGELIGVPTAGRFGLQMPGKIGLVRPINLANPLINQVLGRRAVP